MLHMHWKQMVGKNCQERVHTYNHWTFNAAVLFTSLFSHSNHYYVEKKEKGAFWITVTFT